MKVYIIVYIISMVIVRIDYLLKSSFILDVLNSYLLISVTLFAVLIALYIFISPFIYAHLSKLSNYDVVIKTLNLILDGIKESVSFFFIGIFIFIVCKSQYIAYFYLKEILYTILIFCLGMLCQNLIDHTLMIRNICFRLSQIEKSNMSL